MQQRSTRPAVDRRQTPNSRHSPVVTDRPWEAVFPEACHNLASLNDYNRRMSSTREPGCSPDTSYQAFTT